MQPAAQSSGLPDSRTTTELYRWCMNLSEEARSLLIQNEGMNRLGLNAQVLSARSLDQGRALEVIVSDIGRLSREIRGVLGSMEDAAKFLSAASIEVLHLSLLDSGYAKGRARGIDPGTADVYAETHAGIRSRKKIRLSELKKRLRSVAVLVEDLSRIAQQLLPVTTMIRIVVGDSSAIANELLGTVDELNAFRGHLGAKVEHMRDIQIVCANYVQELDKEGR